MSKYKLSVVIPCYNEEGNIHALYDRLQKLFNKHKLKAEIVFVNDSSNDETPGLINDLAKKHSNVKAFHHETNQGMEKAWNTGIENAKGNYVCLIDADLQYLPEEIWKLYRKIQNDNYDLVQGVRSSIGRVKDSRYLLSKALNFILNIIFGMNAKDNKSGFVIAERETLKNILKHKYNYHYFQTFITVSAKVKGYSIGEVETLFQSRYAGESFINKFPLQLVLKVLSDLAKGFAEYVILKDRIGSTDEFLAEYSDKIKEEHNSQDLSLLRQILFKLYFWTFPIHKWKITKKSQRYYHHLKKTQWLKSEDIEDLQNKRLRRLIKHVYTHVPYYRNLFNKNNIKVEDIKTSQDLEKIPLLPKPYLLISKLPT
jgi:phenylacetate-CoA ligase